MTSEQSQFDDDKTYVDLGYAAEDADFDDDATIIRPLDAEMMWVLVTEKANVVKLPLSEGLPVSIGREKGQDAVLTDKIISRRHLVLTRRGDMVDAEILGANGVQFDGVSLKNETRKLFPPAQIDIGADIKIEISKDEAAVSTPPVQVSPVAASTPTPPPPAAEPTPQASPEPPKPTAPAAQPKVVPPVSMTEPPPPLNDFKAKIGGLAGLDQKKILIGSGILAVLLIVGLILLFSGGGDKNNADDAINLTPKEVPQFQTDAIPEVAEKKALKSQGSNLHAMYISEAQKLYDKGQYAEALEYLQDIPSSSASYDDAQVLIRKISRR